MMAFTIVKMADAAAIPMARVPTDNIAATGCLRHMRTP
jgi:hypothetical protein